MQTASSTCRIRKKTTKNKIQNPGSVPGFFFAGSPASNFPGLVKFLFTVIDDAAF